MTARNSEIQKWAEELIVCAFEKAQRDSNETAAHGLSKYLSENIEETLNERIEKRTFIRYYDACISRKSNKSINPRKHIRDVLSHYLGYKDFKDFIEKTESETEKIVRILKEEHGRLGHQLNQSLKVDACDTTNFLKSEDAVIFYHRQHDKVAFFTYQGEHPFYEEKHVKPLNTTIIKAHVQPCYSISIQ